MQLPQPELTESRMREAEPVYAMQPAIYGYTFCKAEDEEEDLDIFCEIMDEPPIVD